MVFATCISCRNRRSRRAKNPSSGGKTGRRESQVQKEADGRAVRARRNEGVQTQRETGLVAIALREEAVLKVQGAARKEAAKVAARIRSEDAARD